MGIKARIRKILLNSLPRSVIAKGAIFFQVPEKPYRDFVNLSFSQEGEDLVLYRLIGHKSNGFYVDVGAHHPYRFSNTFKFYLLGWKGINIDALPGSMKVFDRERPNDINVEIPILGNPLKEMIYYMFDEPALNTFDVETANYRETSSAYRIVNKISLKPQRLEQIFENYLPEGQRIDFLSVDVEGKDLEVLMSNNWLKFRPEFIVAESLSTILKDDLNSEISRYLNSLNYSMIAKTANSIIYSQGDK